MSFRLTSNSTDFLRGPFESFLIHVPFNVDAEKGTISPQYAGCLFAVYGTYESGASMKPNPSPMGKETKAQSFELEVPDRRKLGLKSLLHFYSRRNVFCNETSELHLFRFTDQKDIGGSEPKTWIKDSGWSLSYKNREKIRGSYRFIKQTVSSFGSCKDRECFWVMAEDDNLGTSRFAFSVPFLKSSILSNILQNVDKTVPKLELKQHGKVFKALAPPLPTKEQATGSVVVTAGAFSQMSLNRDLEQLHAFGDREQRREGEYSDFIEMLAERRGTAHGNRDLGTAGDDDRTTLVPQDNHIPAEVLYLNLNPNQEVERLGDFR